MALAENHVVTAVWRRLRGKMGVRFTRFLGAAAAALVSWFAGAVVSYVLSRWAWERKGRPDVLRETIPFWVISAMVIVILTLANKFAYHSASWMHLAGAKDVLWVDFIWLVANFFTFILRFFIFHFVLFTDRTTAARAAATGPDAPSGTRPAPAATAAESAQADVPAAAGTSANPEIPRI